MVFKIAEFALLPDVIGCMANLFLIIQLFFLRRHPRRSRRWVSVWIVGYVIFGFGALFAPAIIAPYYCILPFLAPLAWIVALFLFVLDGKNVSAPAYVPPPEELPKGVLPPPPSS